MAGMSVDGLVSGMDTTALIGQLIRAEAAPQSALKTRLSATQNAASAYRTVNTTFLAVTAAAEALMKDAAWSSTKATSSSTSVAVTAGAGATPASLTFSVDRLATAHAVTNRAAAGAWTSATSAYGAATIEVFSGGVSKGSVTVGGTGTLADAAAALTASPHGLTATVVQLGSGEAALQVTSRSTGLASEFSLAGNGTFTDNTVGQDAQIRMGTTNPLTVTSPTNTFDKVLTGASFTVGKVETGVTVGVTSDPDAVAAKVAALADAINAAANTVRTYTSSAPGSTAALKGEYAITSLTGQLLTAVSGAVGGGSPASAGFQLTRDGRITFDKAVFLDKLAADPALARRIVAGAPAAGSSPAVDGVAGRVLAVAKAASDSTTGSILGLAKGQDSLAKDIQSRIEAWDVRLARRKEMLTRQFSAMETALSSLRNQSTWLAGQINSLPSHSG